MGFDVTPYVTQNYTNDQDKLEAGITKLRPGGGTALFDAVYTACRDQLIKVPPAQAGFGAQGARLDLRRRRQPEPCLS